ncbi:hypothetical protein M2459_001090 [Parabacteroides sp. PF5-5]|uniref:hypothetical protein n=1 Tax=unclassified Parabacteroides TaxID=2649774 RepID=UPI0024734AC0|nr:MULTISPECIES: hypothetical protein [unclassified Parabacteroides]MDH6304358.1 hypothetical protein [Parabacteroides sp. PH5-39]MDH6315489.1 hypothetical protein [Parabacteroides sp. PF5-13]MDH6319017.1 hypothetical protein [Parabacteroides sp. PH5-13]MDH6322746.1 hypothetical protein [Parabacteroides sp. PH5-8]MDH6326682.1 hypothetical protein [Parabacteroides sp. PH5-41]
MRKILSIVLLLSFYSFMTNAQEYVKFTGSKSVLMANGQVIHQENAKVRVLTRIDDSSSGKLYVYAGLDVRQLEITSVKVSKKAGETYYSLICIGGERGNREEAMIAIDRVGKKTLFLGDFGTKTGTMIIE